MKKKTNTPYAFSTVTNIIMEAQEVWTLLLGQKYDVGAGAA